MSELTLTKAVFQFTHAWRKALDQRLKPFNLSQAKWRLLLTIQRHKQSLNQKELALSLGIEGSSIAGLIDRLSKDKWLVRERSILDRRVNIIKLTPKGKKMIKKIHKVAEQLRFETLAFINKEDLQHCITTLQKLSNTLEQKVK
jgi:MarR family transcriptional regulator for hemolysin